MLEIHDRCFVHEPMVPVEAESGIGGSADPLHLSPDREARRRRRAVGGAERDRTGSGGSDGTASARTPKRCGKSRMRPAANRRSYVLCATARHDSIQKAFKRNAALDADALSISTDNGTVTIHGNVSSWAEHDEALDAAWAAPGVTSVHDEMTVAY
jgi:hypothetical protein